MEKKFDLEKWFQTFLTAFTNEGKKNPFSGNSERAWTDHVRNIIHGDVFRHFFPESSDVECICKSREKPSEEERNEYLSIDITWVNEEEWFPIPELVAEIENDKPLSWYHCYCAWKLFSLKCPRKVLICFLSPADAETLRNKINEQMKLFETEEFLLVVGEKFKGHFKGFLKRGIEDFIPL